MLRSTIAALGTTALLATTLVTTGSPTASADYEDWGTADGKNQRLRQGCHDYRYDYRMTPPTDDWSAEVSLINPRGRNLASDTIDAGSDPASGARFWRICKPSTVPGRHKIKMKVTYCPEPTCRERNRFAQTRPKTFWLTRR